MKKIETACIIDDDPIYLFGTQKLMELVNFSESIFVFQNGDEAIKRLKSILSSGEKIPDVILLDLNMPVMDGWEFLDEFVKLHISQKIHIYIVTSSIDPSDLEKVKHYPEVTNYMIKPLSVEDLKHIKEAV